MLALVIPAAVLGVLIERLVLGPALASLAASYATPRSRRRLRPDRAVLAGLLVAGAMAVLWVTRQATRETVVAGLAAT